MAAVVAVAVATGLALVAGGDDQPRRLGPDTAPPTAALARGALHRLERLVSRAGRRVPRPSATEGRTVGFVVDNARALDVRAFSTRYLAEDSRGSTAPPGTWSGVVETTWAFGRLDRRPARAELVFEFRRVGDRAVIVGIGGGGRRTPLWLSSPVEVRRATGVLVVLARGLPTPGRYLDAAAAAVRAVRAVFGSWRGRLVVEVPGDDEALALGVGADPTAYVGTAAVTTTVDGSLRADAPVHVFVNPEVFGRLTGRGRRVVMTHEAAHVAGDAPRADMPAWLVEGVADYVALREVRLPLTVTAAQAARRVRIDGLPRSLPADDDLRASAAHVGAAYEAAWLACLTLVAKGGEQRLLSYYRLVRDGTDPDRALHRVFGWSRAEFVRAWRQRLAALAR